MPSDDRGGRTCSTCDFHHKISHEWGRCQRRSPVILTESKAHEQNEPIEYESRSVFPMTQPTDWCGEWERRR